MRSIGVPHGSSAVAWTNPRESPAESAAPSSHRVTRAVGEPVAAAWQGSAGDDPYLSVRFRDDALRLVAYDARDVHGQPWLAARCEARRRARRRYARVGGLAVRGCG
ncbi:MULTISPECIES: hypothetical protein [unclassified Streptomyces]|uniref:hypothetical protein n=1 Tax=unclassified Streptomyces TaxID=2593676 RepID=UPI0006B02CBA|nr:MULTISPECIES: hypothetical protein [unclassified Streptomyces]KOX18152.1 hypothetical protein ADL06_31345 [Streptomyces sp. NRRL F-6491]KOX37679.1 hypothetical protein ADL08_28905 [Streptomyces sp. NRRL F-6492]